MHQSLRNQLSEFNRYGNSLYERGAFAEAIQVASAAVDWARQNVAERYPEFAETLNNLAMAHHALGHARTAESLLQAASDLWRRTLGDDHPQYGTGLANLAIIQQDQGKYAEAEQLYLAALCIRERTLGKSHPDYTAGLNNLAVLYATMGDFRRAGQVFQQVLDIDRRHLGEDHRDFAVGLLNLAINQKKLGDYASAEALLRRALAIFRSSIGENHPAYAKALDHLASIYLEKGNYSTAEQLLQEALRTLSMTLGKEHVQYAEVLDRLGGLYATIGSVRLAVQAFQDAFEIRRKSLREPHPDLAVSLNNLAMMLHVSGEDTKALDCLQQAVEILAATLGTNHPLYAETLTSLGSSEALSGNLDRAETLYAEGMETCRHFYGNRHASIARGLFFLAFISLRRGNWQAAVAKSRRALGLYEAILGDTHIEVARTLHILAAALVAAGEMTEVLRILERTAAIEERLLTQIFSIGSEAQRDAYLRMISGSSYACLSLIVQHFLEDRHAVRFAIDQVLKRKSIGLEAMEMQRDLVLGNRYPELRPRLNELTNLRMQIAQRSLAGPSVEGLAVHEELLVEWIGQKEALERDLASRIPEMHLQQRLLAAGHRAVALQLPPGTILVEYVWCPWFDGAATARGEGRPWKPAHYLALVSRAEEPDTAQLMDLGEAEPIDEMIAAFRVGITADLGPDTQRDMGKVKGTPLLDEPDQTGRALRAAVFDKPAVAFGSRRSLLLAPDGDLARLPFEVLPTDDGRRLIDDYCISYIGCGRDVLRFQARSIGQPTEALVAADPDFDLRGDGKRPWQPDAAPSRQSRDLGESDLSFDRLLGTREEGERIAQLLKVRPWLQAEVLEQQLKRLRSPWILHLATHGFFLADQRRDPEASSWTASSDMGRFSGLRLENPLLRSGLALAGGNTWLQKGQLPPEAEDGLLTAEDVTGLDLLDTELVVLSACNTGLGEIRTGEGVFGLRRAFVLAGAKTLIMSLWKVPDEETRELMEDFYRRILAGEPRAEALRNAQLTMKAKYPHPFFWGAFICQGNPGSLPPRRRWYYSLDGKKGHGPVNDAELKDLVRTGMLTRSGKVSLDRKTWHEASHLKGISWPPS